MLKAKSDCFIVAYTQPHLLADFHKIWNVTSLHPRMVMGGKYGHHLEILVNDRTTALTANGIQAMHDLHGAMWHQD